MSVQPLVSVITPCYNGERYVIPFLESILAQDYRNFELIFVNDGSTDKTEEIALSYGEKIKARGASFVYIYQENAGQSAAVNQGLAIFSGDYMMWMDSDDIMYPNHLSEKVRFLEAHTEYDFVLAQGEVVTSEDLNKRVGVLKRTKPLGEDSLFADLIYEQNVVFCPGVIMARRSALLAAIPSRKCYPSREGQNWQLMLPLAYSGKCGYLEKILFKCVAHSDSHSRLRRGYTEQVKRRAGFEELINETIKRIDTMPCSEKDSWHQKVRIHTCRKKLMLAYRYSVFADIVNCRKELKRLGCALKFKDTFIWFCVRKIKQRFTNLIQHEKDR